MGCGCSSEFLWQQFISFLNSVVSLPVQLLLLMVVYISLYCFFVFVFFFVEDLEPGSPSERLKEALSYRDKFQSLYLVSHCFKYVVF